MNTDTPATGTTQHTGAHVDDRAIPDHATATRLDPLNRRGRRNLAGEIRRAERRAFRSLKQQAAAGRLIFVE